MYLPKQEKVLHDHSSASSPIERKARWITYKLEPRENDYVEDYVAKVNSVPPDEVMRWLEGDWLS